jgi:iron complex outermembrane receptor protein
MFCKDLPVHRFVKMLAFAAGLALIQVPAVQGQETGDLMGRVIAEGTRSPIETTLVLIEGTGARATADAQGRFHLHRLPAGPYTVLFEAIGYISLEQDVIVIDGQTVAIEVKLAVRAVSLQGLEVNVLRPDLHPEGRLGQQAIQEANPRDPGELLREIPGVAAVRRGPLGLDPVVRGLRESEVGTYIDGERRFPAGPARMDSPLTHVDPLAFRNIEVAKGPYALTWGAGNLAAVRVETQRIPPAQEGLHGNLTGGYDSNIEAAETSGALYGRSGAVSYWGFGAYREGSDYDDGNGNEIPGDFDSWEARGKLGFETGEGSRLVVGGGYQDQGPLDYPGRLLNAELFHTANVSLGWESDMPTSQSLVRGLDFHVYYNDTDHNMTNDGKPTAEANPSRTPPFPLDISVITSTELIGGRGAAILDAGKWELEVGVDAYSANRNAVRFVRRADMDPQPVLFEDLIWPDVTISDAGLFARGERRLGEHATFTLAGRLDIVSARADTASDFFANSVSTNLESDETNFSAAATLGLGLSPSWTLFLGAGSAVRTADVLERYSDRFPASKAQISAEFVGNPDLKPERSNQADVWVEGSFKTVSVQASVFARTIDNYITLTPTTLPKRLPLSPDVVFQYINGDATFWGFDAQAAISVTPDWTLKLAGDYLWAEDDLLNEPLIGIAPPGASIGVRYEFPTRKFYGEATLDLVDGMDAGRVATTRGETATDGYATGEVRFGWQASNQLLVRFGVENIGDKFIVDHLNAKNPFTGMQVAEAGRVFFGRVSVAF